MQTFQEIVHLPIEMRRYILQLQKSKKGQKYQIASRKYQTIRGPPYSVGRGILCVFVLYLCRVVHVVIEHVEGESMGRCKFFKKGKCTKFKKKDICRFDWGADTCDYFQAKEKQELIPLTIVLIICLIIVIQLAFLLFKLF